MVTRFASFTRVDMKTQPETHCVNCTFNHKESCFTWDDSSGHLLPRDLLDCLYLLELCWHPVPWPQLGARLFIVFGDCLSSLSCDSRSCWGCTWKRARETELEGDWLGQVHCKKDESNHKLASEIMHLLCLGFYDKTIGKIKNVKRTEEMWKKDGAPLEKGERDN